MSCLVIFSWISLMVWNLFLSKVTLVLGKSRGHRDPNMGCSSGWVTWVIYGFTKKFCMRYDAWAGALSWWSCQSPVAHSCSLLNYPNSFYGRMFKLTANIMWIHCSTCSVILNVTATQYTCSLHGIYHSHWLVKWSHHYSCMLIPVYSPWLPGYINVVQAVLVILKMAGLFSG